MRLPGFFLAVYAVMISFTQFSYTQTDWEITWDSNDLNAKQNYLHSIQQADKKSPNIILIVADDLGKYDLSLYGNLKIQTPNIDALGKNGAMFTDGYATAPICSPSRAGLLTGRYQQRFGYQLQPQRRYPKSKFEWWAFKNLMNTNDIEPAPFAKYPNKENIRKQGLPPTEITIAEMLHHAGYATACIGKWHLGYESPLTPLDFGFDYQYGCYEAFTLYAPLKNKNVVNARVNEFTDKHIWKQGRKGPSAIRKNGVEIIENEYLTYAFARETKEFISNNKNQPFFVYLPVTAPHTPYQAPKDIYDSLTLITDHKQRVYYSMIVALDNMVGELMEYLKNEQLIDNTMIIFTSDNGAALYSRTVTNYPLTGGKFTFYEGGINVPLLLYYEGKIPKKTVVHEPVMLFDIFATIADVADIPMPTHHLIDGKSLLPICRNNSTSDLHSQLFWYSSYNLAMRKGKWKLIINNNDQTIELYEMEGEHQEINNLSDTYSTIASQLQQELRNFEAEMPKMLWPRLVDYELVVNGKKTTWGI